MTPRVSLHVLSRRALYALPLRVSAATPPATFPPPPRPAPHQQIVREELSALVGMPSVPSQLVSQTELHVRRPAEPVPEVSVREVSVMLTVVSPVSPASCLTPSPPVLLTVGQQGPSVCPFLSPTNQTRSAAWREDTAIVLLGDAARSGTPTPGRKDLRTHKRSYWSKMAFLPRSSL